MYMNTYTTMQSQLSPTFSDPMDCSMTGSSVHGIFQYSYLYWKSRPRDWTHISCIFLHWQVDSSPLNHLGSLNTYTPFPNSFSIVSYSSGSDCKESACSAADLSSIPGWGRSPREGNGYPLQYSCLENSMDRGAWRATVHGDTKSLTWLSKKIFFNFMGYYKTLNTVPCATQ